MELAESGSPSSGGGSGADVPDEFVAGRPHPALAGVVGRYQGYGEYGATPVRRPQAPTGVCPLIIGFGGPLALDGPSGRSAPTAFVAGLQDGPVMTSFTGHQRGVQVDLTPTGLWRLLRRPMSDLAGEAPALCDLAAPALAGLPERLADAPDWASRFAVVDAVLRGLLDGAPEPSPEVAYAWSALSRRGDLRVADLAGATGWSRRHLLTRFREQVGVAPKQAGRVLRFARGGARGERCARPGRRRRVLRVLRSRAPRPRVPGARRVHADGVRRGVAGEFPDVQARGRRRLLRCTTMSMHPTLRYTDVRAAVDFLTGTLGLRAGRVHAGDDGAIGHAELAWDDDVVLLGPRRDDDPFDTGRAVLYLTVDDVDPTTPGWPPRAVPW